MLEALDSAVSINQLRDPNFKCDLLSKISMLIVNVSSDETLPACEPPTAVSRASIKLDKSEFVTKRSIILAQRARDLMNKCGSFGDDKFAESISNGSINMIKPMPLNIIRNTKQFGK